MQFISVVRNVPQNILKIIQSLFRPSNIPYNPGILRDNWTTMDMNRARAVADTRLFEFLQSEFREESQEEQAPLQQQPQSQEQQQSQQSLHGILHMVQQLQLQPASANNVNAPNNNNENEIEDCIGNAGNIPAVYMEEATYVDFVKTSIALLGLCMITPAIRGLLGGVLYNIPRYLLYK